MDQIEEYASEDIRPGEYYVDRDNVFIKYALNKSILKYQKSGTALLHLQFCVPITFQNLLIAFIQHMMKQNILSIHYWSSRYS